MDSPQLPPARRGERWRLAPLIINWRPSWGHFPYIGDSQARSSFARGFIRLAPLELAVERRHPQEVWMSLEPIPINSFVETLRVSAVGLGLLMVAGCMKPSRDGHDTDVQVRCLSEARPTSAILPDSHWLRIDASKVENVSPTGQLSWTAKLPSTDALLPGFSVAPNATLYMRDKQRVLALGSEGAWLWQRQEPIQGPSDATYQPAAMSDSGVIVRSDRDEYHAYSHTGALRWSVEVDLKGGPSDKPLVLPNGLIIVPGVHDSICLSPDDGKVEWRKDRS